MVAFSKEEYPYLEYCRTRSFILSKVVDPKRGDKHMALIQNTKQKLEIDVGAKMGAGDTRKFLEAKGFKDNTPLGAAQLVMNEDVCLHHTNLFDPTKVENDPDGEEGRKWLQLYKTYANAVKHGALIVAVKPEYFQDWAKSGACLLEVEDIPDGRLFAYIEHTDDDEGGRQGYIVAIDAQKKRGAATVANGKGYTLYANGNYYHGDLKNDYKNGHGTFTYADGGNYVGDWKDDKKNGYGTNIYINGDKYEGDWKDNVRNGHGTFTYAVGGNYVGEWKDDKMNGHGTNIYVNGNKYEGDWKDNARNGHGTITYADGGNYVGDWKDDVKNGHGTLTDTNGNKVQQQWKNGKQC